MVSPHSLALQAQRRSPMRAHTKCTKRLRSPLCSSCTVNVDYRWLQLRNEAVFRGDDLLSALRARNRVEYKREVVCCSSNNSQHVQFLVPGQPGRDDSSNPERRTAAFDSNTEQAARQGEAVRLHPIPSRLLLMHSSAGRA
eukprot:3157-Heterococcus_DN1.PRE.2